MLWLGVAGFILALLLLAVNKIIVSVELHLKMEPSTSEFFMGLRLGGWRIFRRHFLIPSIILEEIVLAAWQMGSIHPSLTERTIKSGHLRLPRFLRISLWWARLAPVSATSLLNKLSCQRLEWSTRIGTGNPALTGFTVGCLWFLKHQLLRKLTQRIAGLTAVPRISITPDFTGTTFALALHCIFVLRVGHIISAIVSTCWLIFCSLLRGERIEQPSH